MSWDVFLNLWFLATIALPFAWLHRILMALWMYRHHGTWISYGWIDSKAPRIVKLLLKSKNNSYPKKEITKHGR